MTMSTPPPVSSPLSAAATHPPPPRPPLKQALGRERNVRIQQSRHNYRELSVRQTDLAQQAQGQPSRFAGPPAQPRLVGADAQHRGQARRYQEAKLERKIFQGGL